MCSMKGTNKGGDRMKHLIEGYTITIFAYILLFTILYMLYVFFTLEARSLWVPITSGTIITSIIAIPIAWKLKMSRRTKK